MPRWVFWGVAVPWIGADLFTFGFCMFYMADEHDLDIRARLGRTLKRWNRDDPVSAEERRRNDLIEKLQGNRNRFIDDPELVEHIGK